MASNVDIPDGDIVTIYMPSAASSGTGAALVVTPNGNPSVIPQQGTPTKFIKINASPPGNFQLKEPVSGMLLGADSYGDNQSLVLKNNPTYSYWYNGSGANGQLVLSYGLNSNPPNGQWKCMNLQNGLSAYSYASPGQSIHLYGCDGNNTANKFALLDVTACCTGQGAANCDPKMIISPDSNMCDTTMNLYCSSGSRILTDPACQRWMQMRPDAAKVTAATYCSANIGSDSKCRDWCKERSVNGDSICDNMMSTYCASAVGVSDSACACINSPLRDPKYGVNPKCTDNNCFRYGYIPSNMRITSCPAITNCDQINRLETAGVQLATYTFRQDCGQKVSDNGGQIPTTTYNSNVSPVTPLVPSGASGAGGVVKSFFGSSDTLFGMPKNIVFIIAAILLLLVLWAFMGGASAAKPATAVRPTPSSSSQPPQPPQGMPYAAGGPYYYGMPPPPPPPPGYYAGAAAEYAPRPPPPPMQGEYYYGPPPPPPQAASSIAQPPPPIVR